MPVEKPDASLVEVIRAGLDSTTLDLHTSMPGIVKSYDDAENTADIQPAVKRKLDGEVETLPVIKGVPVAWLSGAGSMIKLSLEAGDMVWLIFSETSWAKYASTGQVAAPDDLTRHPLSYPVAYPMAREPVAGAIGPGWFTTEEVYIGSPTGAKTLAMFQALEALRQAIITDLAAFPVPTPTISALGAPTTPYSLGETTKLKGE